MPLRLHNQGNCIANIPVEDELLCGDVVFSGAGSSLTIGAGCQSSNLYVHVGENCHIHIGSDCALGAAQVFTFYDSEVIIGNNVQVTDVFQINCHEPYKVEIGKECLFASGCMITVSDMHSIVDASSGALLNEGAPVTIGRNVWLATRVLVLKGSKIGNGSIIGAHSVVSEDIPENCLAVGSPARPIKRNVTWNFQNPYLYQKSLGKAVARSNLNLA